MKKKSAQKQHFSQLGLFLKKKRLDKKMTQSEVAFLCQCKAQFVSNWERGLCAPPFSLLKKIIKAYDIQERQIFNFMMKEYEELLLKNLGLKKRS